MVNNNELFAKIVSENPPQYNLGDMVYTNMGIGFITNRIFKDREKTWKFTVRLFGLNNFYIDADTIYGKVP